MASHDHLWTMAQTFELDIWDTTACILSESLEVLRNFWVGVIGTIL
jgi:hypothetical protein